MDVIGAIGGLDPVAAYWSRVEVRHPVRRRMYRVAIAAIAAGENVAVVRRDECVVAALAANELLDCDTTTNGVGLSLEASLWNCEVDAATSITPVASGPTTENVFKVGGRQALAAAGGKQAVLPIDQMIGAQQLGGLLFAIAFVVFREHGPSTCLLTLKYCVASQPDIVVTQEQWAALRMALRSRNRQMFIDVVSQIWPQP